MHMQVTPQTRDITFGMRKRSINRIIILAVFFLFFLFLSTSCTIDPKFDFSRQESCKTGEVIALHQT